MRHVGIMWSLSMYDENQVLHVNIENLKELLLLLPMPTHIKETATGKYIASNTANIALYGFSTVEEIVGQTVFDLDAFMRPYWGDNFAKKIVEVDSWVVKNNKVHKMPNSVLVTKQGIIRILDIVKIPLSNENHKVTTIFTNGHDRTDDIGLFSLLKTYRKTYGNKHKADLLFCNYLKINGFFSKPLSSAELNLLLCAQNCSSRYDLAKKMNRSIKTVETHITHINNKLKIADFSKIVDIIRSSRKLQCFID